MSLSQRVADADGDWEKDFSGRGRDGSDGPPHAVGERQGCGVNIIGVSEAGFVTCLCVDSGFLEAVVSSMRGSGEKVLKDYDEERITASVTEILS